VSASEHVQDLSGASGVDSGHDKITIQEIRDSRILGVLIDDTPVDDPRLKVLSGRTTTGDAFGNLGLETFLPDIYPPGTLCTVEVRALEVVEIYEHEFPNAKASQMFCENRPDTTTANNADAKFS
jgi:hypothetical protein